MRSTYLPAIAHVFGWRPSWRSACSRSHESRRLTWLPAAACGLLALVALTGCGSVQVSSAAAPVSAGAPGTVSGTNPQPPVVNGAPATSAQVGVLYDYLPNVSNPLGNALTFTVTNLPAWAIFNTNTGELTGTPAAEDMGSTAEIEIVVSDGASLASIGPFRITITAAQASPPAGEPPPVISGTPATSIVAGQAYLFIPSASDPSGQPLTFSVVNRPAWTTFNTTTGQLSGTPTAANVGSFGNITISVSNGASTVSLPAFSLTVTSVPAEGAPTISGTPKSLVTAGSAYDFVPTSSDPNGLALTFSVQNEPSWAHFNKSTGELSGTPTASNVGTFTNIVISASNGSSSASLAPFTITVSASPADGPPTITGAPATGVSVGASYSFTPTASDPAGRTLAFSIQNQPAWTIFNANTGQLSGMPAASNVGAYANITISVSDGTATAVLPTFAITVSAQPLDGSPTLRGTPATAVTAGTIYSFTPTATDPEGHELTFSILNQPSWATFHSTTGQLSGTPSAANVGTFANIIISASNGTASASLPAFTITVSAQPADGTPTINGTPPTTVVAGSAYNFKPTATDPQGHVLTFAVQNQPSWATFNTATGQLSGTPVTANIGTFSNIKISVTNGTASASLAPFTITVSAQPVDGAPTIGGTPVTSVNVGSQYSFTPTATDPEGHALTFAIANRPSWANFNTTTGQLSGTPTAGNVGVFANITISVTNGTSNAALPTFSITVVQPVDGAPTISGTPATSINVGSAYSFTPTATDPLGHALTFSIQNQPSWANFNANTGQLSGTPSAVDVGTYANIKISVTNGTANASLPAFTINVTQVSTGSATLDWTIPTQNTNGTPLAGLAGYHVYLGTSATNLNQVANIANPSVTTYILGNLAPGTWYFAVTDYTSGGVESDFSNIANKIIP